MRKMLRSGLTVGLVLAAVGATAPGTAGAAEDPRQPYTGQKLTWGACAFGTVEGAKPAECAQVRVPRDWANPAGGKDFQVTISRVKATGEHLGAVLLNPGGPGGQGSSLAGLVAELQPALNNRYDLIGMDPRGTGREGSEDPAEQGVLCQIPTGRLSDRKDLDARGRSAASIAEHQKDPRAIAEACQSNADSPYVTTWQTAHDMDLIRGLLGEAKLNYLGYSYGSWLGAKYASLFPTTAGKVVLDSSVDWQGRLQADFEDFPRMDQRQIDQVFLPWLLRQYPGVFGADVAAAQRTYEDVRRFVGTQGVSPDNFDALFVGLGSESRWELTGSLFAKLVGQLHGGPAPEAVSPRVQADADRQARARFGVPLSQVTARTLAEPPPDYVPFNATRYAVACGDQRTRTTEQYRALSDRQGPKYPLFGWAYGLGEVCGPWTDEPRQELPNLPAEVADRVLVVQGEFDPQTSYEQAAAAVRAAPGVTRVSVDDSPFHGQYAIGGNPCVDGAVNVFLLNNSRPGNLTCPGTPLPGEDRVFPVAGPVNAAADRVAATVAAPAPSAARAALGERIAEVNAPLPRR